MSWGSVVDTPSDGSMVDTSSLWSMVDASFLGSMVDTFMLWVEWSVPHLMGSIVDASSISWFDGGFSSFFNGS